MSFTSKNTARGGTGKMLSRIRKRFTYTNIAMTLALVFAMTGGAYAASKVLITSTKQIKPSVLAQLKGKAGAKGAAGAQGPAGPSGAQGLAGPAGKDGANGTNGTNGVNGESVTNTKLNPGNATCKEGGAEFKVGAGAPTHACNGTVGFIKKLPKGETETGVWSAVQGPEQAAFSPSFITASFNVPLAAAVPSSNIEVKPVGYDGTDDSGAEHEACPGTFEEPKAAPGRLCVYTEADARKNPENNPPVEIINVVQSSTPAGVVILSAVVEDPALVGTYAFGTWAVTAE